MHVTYLVSRYPALSETFIAREMQQLVDLGHEITICRLKWRMPWSRQQGLRVSSARVLTSQFGPWPWAKGLAWALKKKSGEMWSIWRELRHVRSDVRSKLKLLIILLTVLRLAQCLDGRKIEHIRAHFLHSEAVGAMWLARLLGISHSITAQTIVFYFPCSIMEKAVNTAVFCCATTRETLELLTTLRGTSEGIHIIRSGINLRDFSIRPGEATNGQPPLVIGVGRLVEKKGFDLLVRACARLKAWDVDFTCKIIGSGPQRDALSQLIAELDIGDRVYLAGAMQFEEVKDHYRQASLLVMPSRVSLRDRDRDGLPNVIIEAMAMGLPVVATDLAGIPDLVIHNQTGLLVPTEDVPRLASAMQQLLEDDDFRARLARVGRSKVEREFDLAVSAQKLEALVRQSILPEKLEMEFA